MITNKTTVNFASQAVPPVISSVQYDNGRSVEFAPSDYTIPSGASAVCHIRQPSGNVSVNDAVIDESKIIVNLTAEDTAEVGDNFGQIRIEADGKTVTSFDFLLLVEPFRGAYIGG